MPRDLLLAYVDPVSGAVLLQLLIAGAIGTVGYFRRSIASFFGRLTGRGRGPDGTSAKAPAHRAGPVE